MKATRVLVVLLLLAFIPFPFIGTHTVAVFLLMPEFFK